MRDRLRSRTVSKFDRQRNGPARLRSMHRIASTLVVITIATAAFAGDEGPAPPPAAKPPAVGGMVFVRVNDQGAEEWFRTKDGALVVRVPGGDYAKRPYEGTVATADPKPCAVESFFIDVNEVTNEQF